MLIQHQLIQDTPINGELKTPSFQFYNAIHHAGHAQVQVPKNVHPAIILHIILW